MSQRLQLISKTIPHFITFAQARTQHTLWKGLFKRALNTWASKPT